MSKIAIFSGSFNPPHIGHAMMASYIAQCGVVDEVWIVPSPLNPLKDVSEIRVDVATRFEMCKIMAEPIPNALASDFEITLPLPNYTYHTLRMLKKLYPQHSFSLVIGSDNWQIFDKWKNYHEILDSVEMLIYPRPDYPIERKLTKNVKVLQDAPLALISSTFVRKQIKEKKFVNYYLPVKVAEYIERYRLYD